MLIYVAGPYSAPTEEAVLANVNAAVDAGIELDVLGHVPFIPHLNQLWDAQAKKRGIDYSHSFWLKWCLVWLAKCDAVLFLGHSPGADIELAFANRAGIPVYFSLDEIVM